MKDANKMTPTELKELAREKEQKTVVNMEGTLKHNIYSILDPEVTDDQYFWLSQKEIDELVKKIRATKKIILPKGLKFYRLVKFKYWYDSISGDYEFDDDWAQKHLIKIKTIINN